MFDHPAVEFVRRPCGRCGKEVIPYEAEVCWYCLAPLCFECWDLYGHCGHARAEEINEAARKVNQPERKTK